MPATLTLETDGQGSKDAIEVFSQQSRLGIIILFNGV
jgi:hypothetical protein